MYQRIVSNTKRNWKFKVSGLGAKGKKEEKKWGEGEGIIHRDDEFKEGEDCEIVNHGATNCPLILTIVSV